MLLRMKHWHQRACSTKTHDSAACATRPSSADHIGLLHPANHSRQQRKSNIQCHSGHRHISPQSVDFVLNCLQVQTQTISAAGHAVVRILDHINVQFKIDLLVSVPRENYNDVIRYSILYQVHSH